MSSSSSSTESETDSETYEVEKILDHRIDSRGRRRFLIQWKGYDSEEKSWEDEDNLNCPALLNEYLSLVKHIRKHTAPKGRLIERPTGITKMVRGKDKIVRYEVTYENKPSELLPSSELLKLCPVRVFEYLESQAEIESEESEKD
jgi:hypothetical protein